MNAQAGFMIREVSATLVLMVKEECHQMIRRALFGGELAVVEYPR